MVKKHSCPVNVVCSDKRVLSGALALALMRTAGLEQLIAPLEPGPRNLAKLKFTKEMPQGAIGRDLAMNVAWVALDAHARRAWDSVRRLSDGQRACPRVHAPAITH